MYEASLLQSKGEGDTVCVTQGHTVEECDGRRGIDRWVMSVFSSLQTNSIFLAVLLPWKPCSAVFLNIDSWLTLAGIIKTRMITMKTMMMMMHGQWVSWSQTLKPSVTFSQVKRFALIKSHKGALQFLEFENKSANWTQLKCQKVEPRIAINLEKKTEIA